MSKVQLEVIMAIIFLVPAVTIFKDFTTALMIVNVIIYFKTKFNIFHFSNSYNKTIAEGNYCRLLTSGFTHANFLHLLCNLYSINSIVPFLEEVYNKYMIMIAYFAIMIIGAYLSCRVRGNLRDYSASSVGASGAICGLFGVVLLLHVDIYGLQGITSFAPTLILLFIMSFNKNIDSYGHFIGLILGLFAGALLNLSL